MKNIPVKKTMFKVTYTEMEGDNYAGGWVTKTTYINELGDCNRFEKILKVEPVFMMIYNELTKDQIDAAINVKRKKEKYKELLEEFEYEKKKLMRLKKEVDKF
jgi:hypothetical protein